MLAKKLSDLVKVYDDVLSQEKCEQVINFFEKHTSLHQRFDNNQRPNFTQLNITQYAQSENASDEDIEMHTDLTTLFMNTISLYQIDCSVTDEMPSQWGLEQIRIKKYNQALDCCDRDAIEKADQFAEHVDVGDHNSARRFVALFLYLNHTETTGKTIFPYLDLQIDPIPGRILVFPPMWMYPHTGLPSFSDNKYIVGTYCHYL